MWYKYLIVILLLYFLAVLQDGFFSHFGLFGGFLNLVFILFFTLVFFEKKKNRENVVFYSVSAGFFLDMFSNTYFGISIISILVTGFLVKKVQDSLKGNSEEYPVVYFMIIFAVSFLAYNLLADLLIFVFETHKFAPGFSWSFVFGVIYNFVVASGFFFVYKKIAKASFDNRQLSLFK